MADDPPALEQHHCDAGANFVRIEIDALQAAGQAPFDAVINAAVSHLRPVLLAAGTTVLGVIPLLSDVFWVSMSVVIMFGLTLGAVITMVLLPTIYCLLFGIRSPADARGSNPVD